MTLSIIDVTTYAVPALSTSDSCGNLLSRIGVPNESFTIRNGDGSM